MNRLVQGGGFEETSALTRSQKAAAVLLVVGPEKAAGVLQHLSEAEVEQIAFEVATLESVAPERMHDVLQEFHDEVVAHQHIVAGGRSTRASSCGAGAGRRPTKSSTGCSPLCSCRRSTSCASMSPGS